MHLLFDVFGLSKIICAKCIPSGMISTKVAFFNACMDESQDLLWSEFIEYYLLNHTS